MGDQPRSIPVAIGQRLRLKIERLAYHSGHGVSRHLGFVVFVPFTAPGDVVIAEVYETHAGYALARMQTLESPSSERRDPPCSVAGRCGGCPWQQVSYAEQVRQKQLLLKEALRRFTQETTVVHPLLASPQEFRYRNRIQVHRHGDRIGYYAAASHELVAIDDCWLAESELVALFPEARARGRLPDAPPEERVEIARQPDGGVRIESRPVDHRAGYFSQVNSAQNAALIQTVTKGIATPHPTEIVDLYCGTGNLTLPLAAAYPTSRVLGIELSRAMIETARQKARGLAREAPLDWLAESCGPALRRLGPDQSRTIVLDPPRPGCDRETRDQLKRLRPRQILYVSCNPTTLARDLESLLANGDYALEWVQGLDMFPQTAHIEAVVSLMRRT